MNINENLYKEFIKNFQEEKKVNEEQISLLDPLAVSMKSNAIRRMFQNWLLILLEIVTWLAVVFCIALIILMDKVYPLSVISKLYKSNEMPLSLQYHDLKGMYWAVCGLIVLLGILFVVIARMISSIRRKNKVLAIAAKNMKKVAEQLLRKRSQFETMQLKFPLEIPKQNDGIVSFLPDSNNNEDVIL